MKKNGRGLKSKIINLILSYDEDGSYIPFCINDRHKGMIASPYVCESRKCKYYVKLYTEQGEKPYIKSLI